MIKLGKNIFLIILLCLFVPQLVEAKDKETLLHFVQISDTHINHEYLPDKAKIRENSEKLFTTAIRQINEIDNVDFVLATGDLINKPEKKLLDKFIEIITALNAPLYAILGNHDVGVSAELSKEEYVRAFQTLPNPTSFTGQMAYYSFSINEIFTVICLDTTNEDFVSRLGRIDDKQLFWLQNELEKNRSKIVILALHISPIDPFRSEQGLFFDPSKKEFLDLIDRYDNVIALFSGDYHAAKLFKANRKIYSIAPATVKYPCAFREVIITEEKKSKLKFWNRKQGFINIRFKWHVIDEPELVEYSKQESIDPVTACGTEQDRENTFQIKIAKTLLSRRI